MKGHENMERMQANPQFRQTTIHTNNELNVLEIFKCDQCDYQSTNSSWLNTHKQKHVRDVSQHNDPNSSPIESFKCPYCAHTAGSSLQLYKHTLCHTGQLNCKVCNIGFSREYAFKAHKDNCENLPWDVSPKMSNNAKKVSVVTKNVAQEDIIDTTDCPDCSYRGSSLFSLSRHRVGHTGEFKGKGFVRFENKLTHTRTCDG